MSWQDYVIARSDGPMPLRVLPKTNYPLSWNLSVFGVGGLTAYFGVTDGLKVKPGDTVVVSAATGATGSLAGGIAKSLGAKKVIGIAGGSEKCRWIVEEAGYDVAIDYKAGNLTSVLKALRDAEPDAAAEDPQSEIRNPILPSDTGTALAASPGLPLSPAPASARQADLDILPTKESQVRPLAALPQEQAVEAWSKAKAIAGIGKQPTAAQVKAAVQQFQNHAGPGSTTLKPTAAQPTRWYFCRTWRLWRGLPPPWPSTSATSILVRRTRICRWPHLSTLPPGLKRMFERRAW